LPSGDEVKTKNPPPFRRWVDKFANKSEPDRRAAQQQRVQQQVQIQITIHAMNLTKWTEMVK